MLPAFEASADATIPPADTYSCLHPQAHDDTIASDIHDLLRPFPSILPIAGRDASICLTNSSTLTSCANVQHHFSHALGFASFGRTLSSSLSNTRHASGAGPHTLTGVRRFPLPLVHRLFSFSTSSFTRTICSLPRTTNDTLERRPLLSHLLHGLRDAEAVHDWRLWSGRRRSQRRSRRVPSGLCQWGCQWQCSCCGHTSF